jgi:hypothetical protein
MSHTASSSTKRLLAEPTKEVGENTELEDRLWEGGDDDTDENSVLRSTCETASSIAMDVEINDGVDIGVPQILDYLSDRPPMSSLVDVREGLDVTTKAASSSAPRSFEVQGMF